MTQFLVLRLSEPVSWVIVDFNGARLGPVSTGSLADAAPLAADRRVVALAPGPGIVLARLELPARSGSRIAQIVPFALEEQLAGDIDAFHFAVGKLGADSRTAVAAVERSQLEAWLQQFAAAGIAPEALYAETQCLPDNPGKIVALLEDGHLLVRAPGATPVALAAEPLSEAFALAGLEGDDRHIQFFVAQQDWDTSQDVIEALREVTGSLDLQLLPDGALPLLASAAVGSQHLSLLSGPYAPRTGWKASWQRWRLAAALAAALLVVHSGAGLYDIISQRIEEKRLDAAIEQTFRVAMPGVERIVDPRRQMQQRLGGTAGADPAGLLRRLDPLSQAMTAVPGVRIRSLGWRDRNLDLRISAPSGDLLTELERAAGQRGISFKVQSTQPHEGGVDGLVSVSLGGST